MALWPFGRKKRKAARIDTIDAVDGPDGPDANDTADEKDEELGISTRVSGPEVSAKTKSRPRSDSRQSSKQSIRKLSKTRDINSPTPPPPVPALPRGMTASPARPHEKTQDDIQPAKARQPLSELPNPEQAPPAPAFKNLHSASQGSLQPENYSTDAMAPMLRPKRSSTTPDAKSSKRRTIEKTREQQIKALSSPPIPIPKRPRSYTGGMLARDSKKIPSGLNRSFARPTSEVSLPVADSLRSSTPEPLEMQNSYKISAFDALSPRPTIRYSESPRRQSGSLHGPTRTSTRKEKGRSIPEEDINSRERMDDLADELNANGLRQLMERDRRRRDRKSKSDQEKLNRKLQRRSEKQKAEEAEAEAEKTIAARLDVEGNGPESARLGVVQPPDASSPAVVRHELADRPGATSPGSWKQDPSKENITSPYKDGDDALNNSQIDLATDDEREEPVLETAQAVRLSAASMSPPASPIQKHARGPSNLSVVTNQTPEKLRLTPETSRSHEPIQKLDSQRDSESGTKPSSGWAAFFRRSGSRPQRDSADRGRMTPSEFSNASRESFQRSKAPPPMPVVQRSFKPKNSDESTPKRTKSKFREELPEYPRTPPLPSSSSRPISPTSPFIDHSSKVPTADDEARVTTPLDNVHPIFRDEVAALSRNQSMRSGETPEPPSSALLSQSLASVDSEGSWLSGRPAKRSSVPISSFRESGGSLAEQVRESPDEPSEAYFTRHAPSPGRMQGPGGLTAALRPEMSAAAAAANAGGARTANANANDDDYDEDLATPALQIASPGGGDEGSPKYNTVQGGHPTLVQGAPALRSREGLLDEYAASTTNSDHQISPTSGRYVGRFSAVSGFSAYEASAAAAVPPPPGATTGSRTPTSPVTPTGEGDTSLHHAKSIDYGAAHSRRVSAGSARLLEILPRSGSPDARSKGAGGGGGTSRGDKRASNLSMELASVGGLGAGAVEYGGRMPGVGELAGRAEVGGADVGGGGVGNGNGIADGRGRGSGSGSGSGKQRAK